MKYSLKMKRFGLETLDRQNTSIFLNAMIIFLLKRLCIRTKANVIALYGKN